MAERPSRITKDTTAGLLAGLTGKLDELQGAVQRQGDRFRAVLEIGAAISSAQDVDALLRLVMDRLTLLLNAEASTLFVLDETRQELWSRVLKGASLREIRVPVKSGVVGQVLRTGKPVLLGDAYRDDHFNPEIDRQSGFKTRSLVAVPLRHVSGRLLGVVEVLHRKVDAFNEEDQGLVEAVASQVASVLENVVLLEALRRRNAELSSAKEELSQAVQDLDLLYEVERSVSSAPDQDDLLDHILSKAMAVIGAQAGSVLLASEEGGSLFFRSAKGERSQELVKMSLRAGQGIAGEVARTGKTIRLAEAESSPHYAKQVAKKLGVEVKSILCVPIHQEGQVRGALELLNKAGGFDQTDERVATLLAGQTGRAIQVRETREAGERKARLAAIGQLLSGVLHDLRTPMTIISGYAQMMAGAASPEDRGKFSEVIEKQFDHINAMTKETLAFARGEKEILVRKVYLQNFAQEVEEYLRKDFEGTGVELKVDRQYDGLARFDEVKVKRLIYNLARNAAQAMPDGGRFVFALEKDAETLVLRFSDTGSGIPEEVAGRLFQSFVTSGKKDGTGLGLAIVKRIAEEHGGGVTFRTRVGKGTTFEVRLPGAVPGKSAA